MKGDVRMKGTAETGGQVKAIRRRGSRGEEGQVLALFALLLVAILGFTGLVIDIGNYKGEQTVVQTAVDAAALAAAQALPGDAVAAEDLAYEYALANDADLTASNVAVSFRCLVGDRNGNGLPDPGDIPAVCDPGANGSFTCNNGICVSPCAAGEGDKCNVIKVVANKNVPFFFAPVLSILGGPQQCFWSECPTGDINAAACRGACGGPPTVPLDVVVIIDRTGSMSSSDLTNAKNGAKAVLQLFDPQLQHVALGVLGPSRTTSTCGGANSGGLGLASSSVNSGSWTPVGFSTDYKNVDDTLNNNSLIVKTINCLNTSSVGTNLGEPTKMAKVYLTTNGRPGVKKAIILMSDGEANEPSGNNPCLYANNQATQAKNSEIEIFTIGFGIEGARCTEDQSDPQYQNVLATKLAADMATDSADDGGDGAGGLGSGCDTASERTSENADGDHFLCEARSGDLTPLFKQAAEVLAAGSRLIPVPD